VVKFLILCLLIDLLVVPVPVGGRVWQNPDGTAVERPSRRSIRAAARQRTVRNPAMLSIRDTPLDRTFSSGEFGTKMQYPSSWERLDLLQRTFPLTLVAMFLSRPASASSAQHRDEPACPECSRRAEGSPEERSAGFRQNVNLVVEDLPSELTLAEYTELGIRMERDYFERYALLRSEDILLAGTYRAHRVIFTASSGAGDMTFAQIWMLRGKQAYVWTFADSAETFDDHVMTFEKMMDTVTVQ